MSYKSTFNWNAYSWVPLFVLVIGVAGYRYGEDMWADFKELMGWYGPSLTIPLASPQYVFACRDLMATTSLLNQATDAEQEQMFRSLQSTTLINPPLCDYRKNLSSQYQVYTELGGLHLVREDRVIKGDPTLGPIEGADMSVRIYRSTPPNNSFVVLLHPKHNGAYTKWAIEPFAIRYGLSN